MARYKLMAIDPTTKSIDWEMPYSSSDITPGVYLDPQIADGVVVDLAPSNGPANPAVDVRGVDVATGKVLWDSSDSTWDGGGGPVEDDPYTCAQTKYFCIATNDALQVIDPTTGTRVTSTPALRAIGVDMYQVGDSPAELQQIGPNGEPAWTNSVSSYFGPGYSPDAGWDFDPIGGLQVGTIGVLPKGVNLATGHVSAGASENIGALKTVGISAASGHLVWTVRGGYECEGPLEFLKPPVICQFSGSLHYTGRSTPASMKGVTLQLVGFDPATGTTTWHARVIDVTSVGEGVNVPFEDDAHVVIRGTHGLEVLDVHTGATNRPVENADGYWCEKDTSTYRDTIRSSYYSLRVAAPTFTGCSATGVPSGGHPNTTPSSVGVTVSGRFVWVSPHGLQIVSAAGAG